MSTNRESHPDQLDLSGLSDASRAEAIDFVERLRRRDDRAKLAATIEAMRRMPPGDEELTPDERTQIDDARASHGRGESVRLEDLERELGID